MSSTFFFFSRFFKKKFVVAIFLSRKNASKNKICIILRKKNFFIQFFKFQNFRVSKRKKMKCSNQNYFLCDLSIKDKRWTTINDVCFIFQNFKFFLKENLSQQLCANVKVAKKLLDLKDF